MNVHNSQTLPVDPRRNHRYSQIIRRVERGELPRGVVADYDATTNILRVDRETLELGGLTVRSRMLACTEVLYERDL